MVDFVAAACATLAVDCPVDAMTVLKVKLVDIRAAVKATTPVNLGWCHCGRWWIFVLWQCMQVQW
jgi:hypothetical protein